jgi:hypothetical protein
MPKVAAAIADRPPASPSSPSVRLTAFELPDHQHGPRHEQQGEHREVPVREERQAGPFGRVRARGPLQQVGADQEADEALADQLVLSDQALRSAAHHFQVVVQEAERPEADEHDERQHDVRVREVGPEQRRDDRGHDDEHAAHGGRARLAEVRLRSLAAHDLPDAQPAQLPDDGGPEHERQHDRRRGRARHAERDVREQIEEDVLAGHRSEQVIQHC